MAATIAVQTLQEGPRNLVVKVQITGDSAGDVTKYALLRPANFNDGFAGFRVDKVDWTLSGFSAELLWDADVDLPMMNLTGGALDNAGSRDFTKFGGLTNNAAPTVTGGINLTTLNLDTDLKGTIILWMVKKYANG